MEQAVAVEMSYELADVYVLAFFRAEKLSLETKKQEVVKEQKKERHLERLSKLHELRQAVVQKIQVRYNLVLHT